jgi:hypothetical protein
VRSLAAVLALGALAAVIGLLWLDRKRT